MGLSSDRLRMGADASEDGWRLHWSGQPVACLLGALVPPDPANPGTVLMTSPVTHRDFDEGDREHLEKFVALRPWSEHVATAVETGGSEADLEGWVDSGLILRLPGVVTTQSFGEVFRGLALVSTTGSAARELTDTKAELILPDDDDGGTGTLPVSRLLYEALRMSSGNADLPSLLKSACGRNAEAEELLLGEVLTMLGFLTNCRVGALIRAA